MWLKKLVADWRANVIFCVALAVGAGLGSFTAYSLDIQRRRDHLAVGIMLAGALVVYLDFWRLTFNKTNNGIPRSFEFMFIVSGPIVFAAFVIGICIFIMQFVIAL